MAQLIVRNVPEETVRKLRLRAARKGRSAEAEHRAILEDALRPSHTSFKELLRAMPVGGAGADFRRRRARARRVTL